MTPSGLDRRVAPIACGVDVIEVDRFRRAARRHGTRFVQRIFTAAERTYAQGKRQAWLHLAARFAAKEAVIKAIAQLDPSARLTMQQIEIANDALGRPHVILHGRAAVAAVQVSLSHVEKTAVAVAVALPHRRAGQRAASRRRSG